MTKLTFEEAAEAVGVVRQTIWRAAQKGKLSHSKDENGVSTVDASELFRVYEPSEAWLAKQTGQADDVAQTAADAPDATPRNAEWNDVSVELRLWRERFEMTGTMHGKEVALLQARIEELTRDRDDFRSERDKLLMTVQEQATTVRLLTAPSPAPASQTVAERRGLFRWLRRA